MPGQPKLAFIEARVAALKMNREFSLRVATPSFFSALQPRTGPHLHRKEIAGDNLPMSIQELFPRCLSTPLRSRVHAVSLQDIRDGIARQLVAQIRQCTLTTHHRPDTAATEAEAEASTSS
jgi:hypothetical protein